MTVTEEGYALLYRNVHGKPPPLSGKATPKRHKYNARKKTIDGITFASTGEACAYADLHWRFFAGQITEPLLQVWFSLGEHYGKQRSYVADFVFVELRTGCLVVADFKGFVTDTYLDKKRAFEAVYGMAITELRRK